MRILNEDASAGSMRIQIETDEDIWHLYNVIEVGDLVTASTTRREEKSADKLRAERAEKKRMTLGVRIEKIEFSEDDLRLKLLGTIENGPQDIGQHHTLIFENGDSMTIEKRHWRDTQIERLRRAVSESKKPRIVFVSLDQDEATVAVLRQFGLKEVTTVRSGRSGKQYAEKPSVDNYHAEIASKVVPLMEANMPLVLLGPGFEKETLAEDLKKMDPETFKKIYVYHTGQSGMCGINEGGDGCRRPQGILCGMRTRGGGTAHDRDRQERERHLWNTTGHGCRPGRCGGEAPRPGLEGQGAGPGRRGACSGIPEGNGRRRVGTA